LLGKSSQAATLVLTGTRFESRLQNRLSWHIFCRTKQISA